MPRFFVEEVKGLIYVLRGEDAFHIIKSLRMKKGEQVILCDKKRIDYICKIEKESTKEVFLKVISSEPCKSEPKIEITIYQGVPKSDKMDLIVQKVVELGTFQIVPIFMKRCISLPDEKSMQKKIDRWQKISKEAAKQSGRGLIPKILPAMRLEDSLKHAEKTDCIIAFYEGGGERLNEMINGKIKKVSIFIGPEGGFEESEIELIKKFGGKISTLGPRILRTETASIVATALISNLSEEI